MVLRYKNALENRYKAKSIHIRPPRSTVVFKRPCNEGHHCIAACIGQQYTLPPAPPSIVTLQRTALDGAEDETLYQSLPGLLHLAGAAGPRLGPERARLYSAARPATATHPAARPAAGRTPGRRPVRQRSETLVDVQPFCYARAKLSGRAAQTAIRRWCLFCAFPE